MAVGHKHNVQPISVLIKVHLSVTFIFFFTLYQVLQCGKLGWYCEKSVNVPVPISVDHYELLPAHQGVRVTGQGCSAARVFFLKFPILSSYVRLMFLSG